MRHRMYRYFSFSAGPYALWIAFRGLHRISGIQAVRSAVSSGGIQRGL
jgi:hypothetical protein